MANNQEQQRLQALLQFAASAGSHGSDPVTSQQSASGSDRAWLNEALRNYASAEFNPVEYIKGKLQLVYHYLHKQDTAFKNDENENVQVKKEDVYEALEEISDNCDHYDLATDLHKIGGFDVMIQCMQHEDPEICWRACEVLAVVAQNHEYCQAALIEMKALPLILKLIDDTSAENKVREKAFYSFSCLVRGNDNVLDHLQDQDGFSVLIRAMQSEVPKLKVKSMFFVRSLCDADTRYADILHELGIEEQIIGMLRMHELDDTPDNLHIVENLLGCLCTLVLTSKESKEECRDPRFELSSTLRDLKKKLVSGGSSYEECIRFSDLIMETCFSEGDATAEDR